MSSKKEKQVPTDKPAGDTVPPLAVQSQKLEKTDVEAEERALKRVCKAMGVDYQDVLAREKKADAESKDLIDYVIPFSVKINGQAVPLRGRDTRQRVDVIMHMVSARRKRILHEGIGKRVEFAHINGEFKAVKASAVNDIGDKVTLEEAV